MNTYPKYEYLWADGIKYKKPIKVSAPEYVDLLMTWVEDMINNGRTAFLSAPLDGMLEGGVPVLVDGQVVGSVGVSGAKPDQDVQVAKAGIEAVAG